MKSSILHLLSLFLILSFTASCGKKEASKGSAPQNTSNPIVDLGNAAGDAAYAQLKTWYDSADTTAVGTRAFYLKQNVGNAYFTVMCGNTIPGIPGCVVPSGCFVKTNLGLQVGQVIMEGSEGRRFKECNITNNGFVTYDKATHQELKDAVLGKEGRFLIPSLTQKTGNIFKVFYGSYSGSVSPTSQAEINTSLPAIVNPTRAPISSSQFSQLIEVRYY